MFDFDDDTLPLLGRTPSLQELEGHIRNEESVVVYGLAGVGKSRLLQAVRELLGQEVARCTIDCERENAAGRVVAAIADRFGILGEDIDPADPVRVRDAALAYLSSLEKRTLIVFDNFETLWEDDLDGAPDLLDDVAEMPHLSLVVAMRTSRLPSDFRRWPGKVFLTGLESGPAIELYSLCGGPPGDKEDLTDLVRRQLEGVPLAIKLVAKGAKSRGMTLDELRRDVEGILLGLPMNLGGDRGKSLETSLRVSTQRLDDHGRRLLALLGVLPAGIAAPDIEGLGECVPDLADIKRVADRLAELGLAFDPGRRLVTLKPIRDYSAYAHWPRQRDLESTRTYYLDSLKGGVTNRPSAHDMSIERPNFTSMAATLPDRVAHCDALIRQGTAELDAGNDADARETFRLAATVARRAREPRLLASAALGISGGLSGPGHTLDRADEERLALLREAKAVLDDDEELEFRILIRLIRELHFDTSDQARAERGSLRRRAQELEAGAQEEDRLQFALLELSTADPAQARVDRTREVIKTARALGDVKAEVNSRQLLVSFLLEDGKNDAAETERAAARDRILDLPRQGDQKAALWQDGVMLRARLLFNGKFDEARRQLEEQRPEGDPADSPYRRWLHQNVVLTLDTGSGAEPQGRDELSERIEEVGVLTAQLKSAECRKFALSSEDQLTDLAYEWWPTWRATHILLLAMRGSPEDQRAAHEGIKGLARRPISIHKGAAGGGPGPRFGRILRHEYYVQVLALITMAIQRLSVLSGMDADSPPDRQRMLRKDWARTLNELLTEFQGHVVVPGSGVMNLGSVEGFRAMAKGCAEEWSEMTIAFEEARDHNQRLGGEPALVRTLVADAEMHRIVGNDTAKERAFAMANEAEQRAGAVGMEVWRRKAQAVLDEL